MIVDKNYWKEWNEILWFKKYIYLLWFSTLYWPRHLL